MHFGPGFAFPVMTALMSAKLIVDSDAFTHDEQETIKREIAEIKRAVMTPDREKHWADLHLLLDRLNSGVFYEDYDESVRLVGVLRDHIENA
jgi:hypothetical protein